MYMNEHLFSTDLRVTDITNTHLTKENEIKTTGGIETYLYMFLSYLNCNLYMYMWVLGI